MAIRSAKTKTLPATSGTVTILFDGDTTYTPATQTGNIIFAASGTIPSVQEVTVDGNSTNSMIFPDEWENVNGGIFDKTKRNVVMIVRDAGANFGYTINNLPIPASYSATYEKIIAKANSSAYTKASGTYITKAEAFIQDLKDIGCLYVLDFLAVLKTNGDHGFANISWRNPGFFEILEVSTPLFVTQSGYDQNGGSGYLNTRWNPLRNGENYQQNSASIIVADIENNASDSNLIGVASTGVQAIFVPRTASGDQYRIGINGASSTLTGSSTDSTGMYIMNRASSTHINLLKNGTAIGADVSQASAGIPDGELFALCSGNFGAPSTRRNTTISLIAAGGNMVPYASDFNQAWVDYNA